MPAFNLTNKIGAIMRLKIFAVSLCGKQRVLLAQQEVTLKEWLHIKTELKQGLSCDNDTYKKAATTIAEQCGINIEFSDPLDFHVDQNHIGDHDGDEIHLLPDFSIDLDKDGLYFMILCPFEIYDGWRINVIDEEDVK